MLKIYHELNIDNYQIQIVFFMIKKIVIPFIKARDYKDKNIHAFEIVNVE